MSAQPSPLQLMTLGVLRDNGGCDAGELVRHMRGIGGSGSVLGPVLGGLERRGMIGRVYSTRERGHDYVITDEGREAVDRWLAELDEELEA